MTRHAKLTLTSLIALCCSVPETLRAADSPKEGRINAIECMVAEGPRIESPAGVVFGGFVSHNVAHPIDSSKGAMNEYGTYCVGHYLEKKAGKGLALGICEQTDADGDKWVIRFRDDGNQMAGDFEFVAGSGKYKDATINGKYTPAGPLFFGSPGRMQRCMHITGSYRLK